MMFWYSVWRPTTRSPSALFSALWSLFFLRVARDRKRVRTLNTHARLRPTLRSNITAVALARKAWRSGAPVKSSST